MNEAIQFWLYSYKEKYFVRWVIVEKKSNTTIGTFEYSIKNLSLVAVFLWRVCVE